MKWTGFLAALCLAVPSALPVRSQAPPILEPQVERRQGPPLWISAAEAADADKVVDLDRIGSDFLRGNVEKQRRELGDRSLVDKRWAGRKPPVEDLPFSDCKRTLDAVDHRGAGGPTSSFSALATRSSSILRGTIRAVAPGFSFGIPSSLLTVEISTVVEGSTPSPVVYIDYPVAHFRIGPYQFCNSNRGFEPQPGDEVLLYDFTGPVDREHVLLAPRLDELFFQRNETLFMDARFKASPELGSVHTLDDVVQLLRREDHGARRTP